MRDYSNADFYKDTSLAGDPHGYFAFLHARGPVTPLPARKVGLAVTGYREAIQIMLDSDHFSAVNANVGALFRLPFQAEGDDIRAELEEVRPTLKYQHVGTSDGELHTNLRSLLANLFTPSRLKALEAGTASTADAMIDEFVQDGHVDFVAQYGKPFTTLMIADLLGVPSNDRERFRGYFSDAVVAQMGSTSYDAAAAAVDKITADIFNYVTERRRSPVKNDVLTEFALARYPDDSEPGMQDLADLGAFLFGAGQDTTNHLIGNGMRLLAVRPDVQDALRADAKLIPLFVEEMLRFDGPIKGEGRLCVKTTAVGGVEIKAGTPLLVSLLAGNRDERRFPDADQFKLDRPKAKEHIAFGRGAHTCIGAPLARLEARVTFERVLARLRNIRLSEAHHGSAVDGYRFEYEPSFIIRALRYLKLDFDVA